MYIFNRPGLLNQLTTPPPTNTNHHIYTREADLTPEARYGIMIALAISSGAFFVACIGLTISMCDWRMRYLHLRKELDERGYGIAARPAAQQENQAAERQGGEAQATDEPATAVSGALQ